MSDVVEGDLVDEEHPLPAAPPTSALALFGSPDDPNGAVELMTRHAKALARVIDGANLAKQIGRSRHVLVEGWTTLGSMVGVYPVTMWTRPLPDAAGWEARVEARTRSGDVVGAAEAMCARTESRWEDADDYAIRSMAQTRATSKALRLPLGFIVALAGFDATPAEEMPEPQRQARREDDQEPPPDEPSTTASKPAAPKVTDDEAATDLVELLAVDVDETHTMPILEDRLRRLYRHMEQLGYWPRASNGLDALHVALHKHHQADHVGDLRKKDLVALCRKSWDAARTKTTKEPTT